MDPVQFTPMAPLDEYGIGAARRRQAQTFTRPSLTPLPVTGYQTGHLYSGSMKNLLQAAPPPELSQIPEESYYVSGDPQTPRKTPRSKPRPGTPHTHLTAAQASVSSSPESLISVDDTVPFLLKDSSQQIQMYHGNLLPYQPPFLP